MAYVSTSRGEVVVKDVILIINQIKKNNTFILFVFNYYISLEKNLLLKSDMHSIIIVRYH